MSPLEIKGTDQPLGIVSDRRLYLKADNWTLAEEGDTAAAFGLIGEGGMIPAAEVARLHLSVKGGKVSQLSREEAYKASGVEMPAAAEAPKAELLVKPTPLPPPPPATATGATPQTPPSAPAAVPADAQGKASATAQTPEEAARLRDRAERMSSGDQTTPVPVHGEPLRAEPGSDTARKTARKGGAKKAGAKKRGA